MSLGGDDLHREIVSWYSRGEIPIAQYERMRSYMHDPDYTPEPQDHVIWKKTGNLFFERKDYNHALKCYANAVDIDHYYLDAINNIGMTYRILGKTEESARVFKYMNEVKELHLPEKEKETIEFFEHTGGIPQDTKKPAVVPPEPANHVELSAWEYALGGVILAIGFAGSWFILALLVVIVLFGLIYLVRKKWVPHVLKGRVIRNTPDYQSGDRPVH